MSGLHMLLRLLRLIKLIKLPLFNESIHPCNKVIKHYKLSMQQCL